MKFVVFSLYILNKYNSENCIVMKDVILLLHVLSNKLLHISHVNNII